MGKTRIWKRLASGLLTAAMVLSMVPVGQTDAAEKAANSFALSASELALGINVIADDATKNSSFMSSKVITTGTNLSLNHKFKLTSSSKVTGHKDPLSTATMKRGDDGAQWYAQYTWTLNETDKRYLNDSNYELRYVGKIKSDSHNVWGSKHHSKACVRLTDKAFTVTTSEYAWDRDFYMYFSEVSNGNNENDVTVEETFQNLNPGSGTLVYTAFDWGNCSCATTQAGGSCFYLVDVSHPKITSAYFAANADGTGAFSSYGESVNFGGSSSVTAYVVMDFSENIRLADNHASGEDIYLNLDAYYGSQYGDGSKKDTELTGTNKIRAKLISLEGSRMVFEFTVPSTINGKNTHVYISGISASQEIWDEEYDLKVFDANGSAVSGTNLTTNCLITDLAGNQYYPGYSRGKDLGDLVFDNVAPTMDSIQITGNMITAESGKEPTSWNGNSSSLSSSYLGVGDVIGFQVKFSEPIQNANNAKATLSITDENGNPIVLTVRKVSGNTITFNNLTITEQMLKAGNRIQIVKIEGVDNLSDIAGNNPSSAQFTSVMSPAQQLHLDVDAPVVTTTVVDKNVIGDGMGGEYFTVPFTIEDIKAASPYFSTVNDTIAYFSLKQTYGYSNGFEWYVDNNQTISSTVQWNYGYTGSYQYEMPKMSDKVLFYLHIHLLPDRNYGYSSGNGTVTTGGVYFDGTVTLTAQDWAGNTSSLEVPVRKQVDSKAPFAGFTSALALSVDAANYKATINTNVLLRDNYSLENATYTWYYRFDDETTFTAGTPITVDVGTGLVKEKAIPLSFDWTYTSGAKRKGEAYVVVSFEDRPGNQAEAITSPTFSFNFTMPVGHYTYNAGTADEPIQWPSLVLSAPTWEGTYAQTPRTLIYISDPVDPNTFWVYDPWDCGEKKLEYTTEDLFQLLKSYYTTYKATEPPYTPITDAFPGRWYKLTGTVDTATNTAAFTNRSILNHPGSCEDLYDALLGYYGKLDMYIVTTYSLSQFGEYDGSTEWVSASEFNFQGAETHVERVTMYLANNTKFTADVLSVKDDQGNDASAVLNYQKGQTPAESLDDVAITFQLKNASDANSSYQYGYELIDFTNSAIELKYLGASTGNAGTAVTTWELAKTADGVQTVVLEPGLCVSSGWYSLSLTVKDRISGKTTTLSLGNYFMDATKRELTVDSYFKQYYTTQDSGTKQTLEKTGLDQATETITLGLDTAPEGWKLYTYLQFKSAARNDGMESAISELSQVRVRNATYDALTGNIQTGAVWVDAPAGQTEYRYVPVYVDTAAGFPADAYAQTVTGDDVSLPKLPMVAGYNTLIYEFKNTNGVIVIGEVEVFVHGESVQWDIDVAYEMYEQNIRTATVTAYSTENPALEGCYFDYLHSNNRGESNTTSYTFTDDLDAQFYLMDQNGNLSVKHLRVEDENGQLIDIDGTAPESIYLSEVQGWTHGEGYKTEGTFCLQITVEDKENAVSAKELKFTFDPYYSGRLMGMNAVEALDNTQQLTVDIPLALDENGNYLKNADGTFAAWESYEVGNYGIYRTQIIQAEPDENSDWAGYLQVLVWGTWMHDSAAESYSIDTDGDGTGDTDVPDRVVTVTSADTHGNTSSSNMNFGQQIGSYYMESGTINTSGDYAGEMNIDAKLTDEDVLGIYTNVPMASINSYGAGKQQAALTMGQGQRTFGTTAPMIVEDGTYTFQVTDLFGNNHDLELWVFDTFGQLGVDVTFSTTELTNQDVSVTAVSTGTLDEIVSITSSLGGKGTIDPSNPRSASITVSENCSITITTSEGKSRTVQVANIDKKLEQAYVVFYDNEMNRLIGSETQVQTMVTAELRCDAEQVYTINGSDNYSFTAGAKAGDSYTFEYSDAAGNTGTVTAVLPCDVVAPPYVDQEKPDVTMNVLAMRNMTFAQLAELRNPQGAAITEGMEDYKAQQFRMVFTITDYSQVKIVAVPMGGAVPSGYAATENGSCSAEGVSLAVSGKRATLTITENTAFDVHIIDENGNIRSVTGIQIGNVDNQAPVLDATYSVGTDEDGYTVVVASFLPRNPEEALEPIIPVTSGVLTRSEQVQTGVDADNDPIYATVIRYYTIFTDNGTFTFNYRDEYGNPGQAVATVNSMNNAAPVVKSLSWYGTAANKTPADSTMVNRDVTAQISMSKAISNVVLYKYDAAKENHLGELVSGDASVDVSFTGTNVYVTYSDNVDYGIVLELTAAANGRKGYCELPAVTCIDKTAPVITVTGAVLAEDNRSMTITFASDEDTLLSQNSSEGYTKVHAWIATTNQPQQLQFSDKAGNITVYTVTENDDIDMDYLSAQYSASSNGSDATTDPLKDLELDSGDKFYVKVNKNAKAILDGVVVGNVKKDVWKEFTLPDEAGVHILELIDSNTGESVFGVVAAQARDTIAPVIQLDSSTVVVLSDDTVEDMNKAVRGGVTVTDDRDGKITGFAVTGCPEAVTAGLYELTYTAQDAAGNSTTVYRTLYVMTPGTPLIRINGEAGLPYGKVTVDSKDIKLEIEGIEDGGAELVIKFRDGIRTTGQMKYYATTVEDMAFRVSESGHYTIYVRTQDRVEYVTYIYVEG